jgi:hypothetical protein
MRRRLIQYGGSKEVRKRHEDGGRFLIYLLDRSFDLVTVGIGGCMSDVSTQET